MDIEGADVCFSIRVSNARIRRAMRARGIRTVKQLADRCYGSIYQRVCQLLSMRAVPLKKDGTWCETALNMSSALGIDPECLWPEYMQWVRLNRNQFTVDATVDELKAMTESYLDAVTFLARYLPLLPSDDRNIIEMRYGLGANAGPAKSQNDVAKELGLTGSRIGQIEQRALRRLREKAGNATT